MIKLPQQPEMPPAAPMEEPPQEMGAPQEMPPMGGMPSQEPNQFDTNFDAGVEADEETDPKKYIQQLTGKLSQSLRSYNENLPQPDADLDKYVAGMIVKQAIEGLSPEDTNEILDKIKTDGEEEEMQQQPEEAPQGQEMPTMDNGQPGLGESVKKPNKHKIDEIFNQLMQSNDEEDEYRKEITDIGYRKKPFTSRNFR